MTQVIGDSTLDAGLNQGFQLIGSDSTVTFTGGSGATIATFANSDTINLQSMAAATFTDNGQNTHISVDGQTLETIVANFASDLGGTVDLTNQYTSMDDLMAHMEVVPGLGTVLHPSLMGPTVMTFLGDFSMQRGQFTLNGQSDVPAATTAAVAAPIATANAAEVYRLYGAALGRAPDAGGQAFWTDALDTGMPVSTLAQVFANSPEFHNDYAGMSTNDLVSSLYQNILHRPGDAGGIQYWGNAINTGLSMGNAVWSFADSPENKMLTAAATGGH